MSPTKSQFKITAFDASIHSPNTKSARGICASGLGSPCSTIDVESWGYATWSIVWPGEAANRAVCGNHLLEILERNGATNLTATVPPKRARKAA